MPALPRSRSVTSTRGTLKSCKERKIRRLKTWMDAMMYVSSCPEGWVRRKDQNLSNGNSNNTKQNNKYLVQTPGRLGSAQPMPQLIMPARNHLKDHNSSVAMFSFTIVHDHKCVFFMGRKKYYLPSRPRTTKGPPESPWRENHWMANKSALLMTVLLDCKGWGSGQNFSSCQGS